MSPRVSVVMPVRDGARWLRAAVGSILAQDFGDFELLAVDDHSTDETPAILAACAAADPRVRVLQSPSPGLVPALNGALAVARGEYLARLDADDWAAPRRLGRQVAALDARPRLGLLGSFAEVIDADGTVTGRLTPETDSDRLKALLARTNPFIHSSLMLRTELVLRLDGYHAAFEAAEDYDLWLRIADVADVANVPEPLIRYRRHGGNVTARKEVRQCFSERLARKAAAARRAGELDPSAGLTDPPDWHAAPDTAFWADDARLYRFLELAQPGLAARRGPEPLDLAPVLSPATPLTHRERRLAQAAAFALLRRPARKFAGFGERLTLVWLAVSLHPGRALPSAWALLTGR